MLVSISPPTPEKKPPLALKFQWTVTKKILNDSDRLLVFGFGFNPYYQAILKLLRKNNQNIKSVLLVSLSDKTKIGKGIWPGAEIINFRPPPLDGNKITDWILKD